MISRSVKNPPELADNLQIILTFYNFLPEKHWYLLTCKLFCLHCILDVNELPDLFIIIVD